MRTDVSEACVFCDKEIANNKARFVSCKGTAACPDCLIEGYPDAEGLQWRFAPGPQAAPADASAAEAALLGARVYTAAIKYEDGVIMLAAVSADALSLKLQDYVREYWPEYLPDEEMPADPDEAVDAYFENNESEWLDTDSVIL